MREVKHCDTNIPLHEHSTSSSSRPPALLLSSLLCYWTSQYSAVCNSRAADALFTISACRSCSCGRYHGITRRLAVLLLSFLCSFVVLAAVQSAMACALQRDAKSRISEQDFFFCKAVGNQEIRSCSSSWTMQDGIQVGSHYRSVEAYRCYNMCHG